MAAICARLDRLPLAIELAAMQVSILSLSDLLERLTTRLPFLRGGARDLPARQQTMRDTIAWSYELLSAAHQRCFRTLGVFVGGWKLEAAEAVCWAAGEASLEEPILTLAALVDASLVQVEMSDKGMARFGMLELIREFALEHLRAAGEEKSCRQRHAIYYAHLAERLAPPGPPGSVKTTLLAPDSPNARAALQWAEEQQDATLGLRLATTFGGVWVTGGQLREAEMWLERMLALDQQAGSQDAPPESRAEALFIMGKTLLHLGKLERAELVASTALERARQRLDHHEMSSAFNILGHLAQIRGKHEAAATFFTESDTHARQTEHLLLKGAALNNLAELARWQGDMPRAAALFEEELALFTASGGTWGVAIITALLGHLAYQQQQYPLAKARYQEALALFRTFGSPTFTAWCLEGLAATLCAEARYEQAAQLCGVAAAMREQAQTPMPAAELEAFERVVATSKASLGEAAFAAEWTVGTALTQDEATAYALSEAYD